MAPVTLPPSFYNSFWTADYRTGLEILFKQLDKGCKEAEELEEFISAQAEGHHTLSRTLFQSPSSPSDSTSSLQHTLNALRSGSSTRGEAHRALALELESRILIGFSQWKERHAERVSEARKEVLAKGGVVSAWEKEVKSLDSLKSAYINKSRAADDSEDDAKFAPPTASSSDKDKESLKSPTLSTDSYTASPVRKSALLQRSGTVADRISEKLRAASISSPLSPTKEGRKPALSIDGKSLPAPPTPLGSSTPADGRQSPTSPSSPREDAFIPPTDPNGKPTFPSFSKKEGDDAKDGPAILEVQHAPILLSGLSLPASALKDILSRFESYLLSNPAPHADASITSASTRSNAALASRQRSTILGTYEKTFSGEEVTEWLKQHVEGFGGDWERSVDAARELTSMGYFARVGVGRGFEPQDDIFYVLRSDPNAPSGPVAAGNKISTQAAAALKDLQKQSPLSPATSANIQQMIKTYVPARFAPSDEPLHMRLRREAGQAEDKYRDAVRAVGGRRLDLEQRVERGLRIWERWERERLSVFQQVLKQYDDAMGKLPSRLREVQNQTQLSIETYNPEADLRSLIEGHRTGPFRPQPHVFESLEVDLPDVAFGIDLRKWAGDTGWKAAANVPKREKGAVPNVLAGLLEGLKELYAGVDDSEKRKAWIYEVPLPEIHALRGAINSQDLTVEDVAEMSKKFNAPVVAGTIKLWLLELNPPVLGWEGWEDAKGVYPSVGADQERDPTSAVTSVLGRLPGAQLYVLDAIVGYMRRLIDSTKTDETEEIFITKLALSLGRCILRPQVESNLTIGDRTPPLFFADLINLYNTIFPQLVDKKKSEAERVMPVRKRTALVDQRPSRRNISEDDTPEALFERQQHLNVPSRTSRVLEKEEVSPVSPRGVPEGTSAQPRDTGKGRAAEENQSPVAPPPSEPAAPPKLASPISTVIPGIPMMADPKDSDDEDEPSRPAVPAQAQSQQQPTETGDDSAMSDILDSYAGAEDQPINLQQQQQGDPSASPSTSSTATGGASGLKRATSGETAGSASRLRGPRGARGPRPAGGRSIGGMTGLAGDEGDEAGAGATAAAAAGGVSGGRDSPQPQASGNGSRPAGGKGSVSAMAARFEQDRK